jgi:hypothetical protein
MNEIGINYLGVTIPDFVEVTKQRLFKKLILAIKSGFTTHLENI